MAAALDLIFTGSTVSLSDGNPYRLGDGVDLSPADVVRLTQRSPTQDGVTDQGYRLAPRVATLDLLFYATTDAILDTYRANLFYYFKPLTDAPLTLRYTRDDGTYRYLSCVAEDEIPIEIVPENRPGHLHKATVKLRAADPKWYSAVKTASFTGGSTQVWWTGGGVIGTANVMEHTEWPTQGQAWTYAGTLTSSWSVVFRTELDNSALGHAAFHAGTGALAGSVTKDARMYYADSGVSWNFDGSAGAVALYDLTHTGTINVMNTHDASDSDRNTFWYGPNLVDNYITMNIDISGTARRWRSDRLGSASSYWSNALPKAAIYDKALSFGERTALDAWMSDAATLGTITAVNSGDLPEYPLITIRGPLYNFYLSNTTTSGTLDFTGLALGSADSLTIDLRTGDKLVTNAAGSTLIGSAVTPTQLAAFYLAPSPTASGGTNTITVTGGSISSATLVTVTYYDRYMSY